ncbi:MAG: GumC family protein, partial [Chitinophagaceae bacterium]
IMVMDEKKGADLVNNPALKEIGLGGNAKLVENEIEVLNSYDLLEDVVDTLQLFVSVKQMGQLRDVPKFGDEIPFSIEILNPEFIRKIRKWTITDTVNGVLFQGEKDMQPILLNFGKIYESGGLKFRCMPGTVDSYLSPKPVYNRNQTYKVNINSPRETVIGYSKKLSVQSASKLGSIINLELKDNNEERAKSILQNLIALYNYRGMENRNRVTDKTIDFLTNRLLAVANDLRGVEGNVEKLKSQNMVTELSSDAQQYMAMSQQVDAQKVQSQTQLNVIGALERDLQINQENPQVVPTTFGIQDTSLGLLIEKHNELVLQKERLQGKSGPRNPLVIDQQNQISELRNRLLKNVRNLKQAYSISLDDISRKDAQLNSRIRNVPQLEKKLVQITRNQNVQEQLYSFLLLKREEAAVSRTSDIEDSRTIVSPRTINNLDTRKYIVLALSILIGLLVPVIFYSIRDFMDNKVGDMQQVQQASKVPFIGMISHFKKSSAPVLISSKSRSAVAEQIRNIRTALSFTGKGEKVKSILISSFQVGDGKSFFSLNLAAGYALLNKKTVILEFDLRRPQISKSLGIEVKEGISSLLSGRSSIEELLIEIPGYECNLFLLPAGNLPPNPAELISGPKMECFINNLQEQFDHIIIDTPPFSLVADAQLLQKYADITIIVLRQGHTSQDVYKQLNNGISSHIDRPVFLLLNDVGNRKRYRTGAGSYAYGKGYYHEEK